MGRESQLNQLHQQLLSNQRIAITALEGMGGIGKTELAWEYAQRSLSKNRFPGGVCWLRSRDQKIATQIVDFSKSHLGMKPPDDLEAKAQVSFIWQRWPKGEVLIVVDDVTDYDAIAPFLPLVNPRFKVLITTRIDFGCSVRSFCLEVLDEESALELLKELAGKKRIHTQLEKAKVLCAWVGNLPLGLELLGRYLANDEDLYIQDLLPELESMRLNTEALLEVENGMTAQLGVAAALELSWKHLNSTEKKLACLLGMFAISPIQWVQVESCLKESTKKELARTRNIGLLKRNLIKRVENGSYQLHQIVQEFFRIKLNQLLDKGYKLKTSFCTGMIEVAKEIDVNPKIKQIEEIRSSIPHLEEISKHWIDYLDSDEIISLYGGISRFYEGQGNYGLSLPWKVKCLKQNRKILGNEHPDIATNLNELAILYYHLGRYEEAKTHVVQALQMRKKLLGNTHPDVACTLNDQANLFFRQGHFEEAEPLYIQALNIDLVSLGNNHPNVASRLNNLGELYRSQERYEEAELLLLQALKLSKKLLGEEHPSVAISLNSLAALYRIKGQLEKAESIYFQSLEISQKLLGDKHPNVASSLNNLGELYRYQERYEEAECVLDKALKVAEEVFNDRHPDTLAIKNNLFACHHFSNKNLGKFIFKNRINHKKIIARSYIYKSLPITYSNDCLITSCHGSYTLKTRSLDWPLLFNEEKIFHLLPKWHHKSWPYYPQLSNNLRDFVKLYYPSISTLNSNDCHRGGEIQVHSSVATNLNKQALIYKNKGWYSNSELLYIQALKIRIKLLGEVHPDVAIVLNNLAELCRNQKRYDDAESLHYQALDIRKNLLRERHISVAISLNNLALVYKDRGWYSNAEPLYIQTLEMRQKLFGEGHPTIAISLNNYAVFCKLQERYFEAEILYLKALEIFKKFLGQKHPKTVIVEKNLDACRQQMINSNA